MIFDKYHIVYFLGVGGIGMSALARYFKLRGQKVYGYDKVGSELTDQLQEENIQVIFNEQTSAIPKEVIDQKDITLVVITPAIPKDHPQWNYFRSEGYVIRKRAEVLGAISSEGFTVSVAGTHGKTTTTAMIAHIFNYAGKNMAAFVGGVLSDYNKNFIVNGELSGKTIFITEADEFDRSFHLLNPDIAVVTSAEPDHLDIYGDHESLRHSFRKFISRISEKGTLIIKETLEDDFIHNTSINVIKYSNNKGDAIADNIRIEQGSFIFDYRYKNFQINDIRLLLSGYHNVENAVAAITVALEADLPTDTIQSAISFFSGVKRRFEYIIKSDQFVFVDDYAHHPTEIAATLKSLRSLFPDKKITAIFQPHLYSRTRDFAEEFANSLSICDQLLLLDIYPAREEPIPGVNSDMILDKVSLKEKFLIKKGEVLNKIDELNIEVLVTIGAGDIDRLVQPIKDKILTKMNT